MKIHLNLIQVRTDLNGTRDIYPPTQRYTICGHEFKYDEPSHVTTFKEQVTCKKCSKLIKN